MSRTYSPATMAPVPRLNSSSTVVLCTEMVTAGDDQASKLQASGQSLPTSIARSLSRLRARLSELSTVMQPALSSVDTQESRNADLELDRAWSGFNDVVTGWMKLPTGRISDPIGVAKLHQLLFPDGLEFLTEDYRTEWQESQARIDAIDSDSCFPATIAAMGGMIFLENIRYAHQAYGKALGITSVKPGEVPPQVREKMDAAIGALRDYLVKVVAWSDPEEPGSEDLSNALLAPIEAWVSQQPASSSSKSASTGNGSSDTTSAATSASSSAPA